MSEPDIPRYEIAEQALKEIEGSIDRWRGSGKSHMSLLIEIADAVDVANARLRVMSLRRKRPKANWLAKGVSFAYPRRFAGQWGADPDPHHCIQVEITDGPKALRDRLVEIQMRDDDMERLAKQMLRMIESRKRAQEKT